LVVQAATVELVSFPGIREKYREKPGKLHH
jgi:hypothetical protein